MQKTLSPKPLQIRLSTKTGASKPLSSTEVAYQWIVKFAAITGKAAERVQQDIWADALSDIPAERLNAACEQLMRTWRLPNFPLPGDVRAQLETADEKGFDLEAEAEWQKFLAWIRENYFPDVGIRRGAPRLSSVVQHAARGAGGFHFIERCSEEELVWCRKTFLAAYKNVHETGQVEHLLGNREARRILAQLQSGPPVERKRILHAPESPSQPPSREEVRAVPWRVSETPKPKELSESELRAWQEGQKKALREWRVSHGLPEDFTEAEMQTSAAVQDTAAKLRAAEKTQEARESV
jgi:hypothetical protein